MPLYTKTGDRGNTSLLSGRRLAKSSKIPTALGSLDELNSAIGLAAAFLKESDKLGIFVGPLELIQVDLFYLGSFLAGADHPDRVVRELAARVGEMEKFIDQAEEKLPRLKNFILPGGSLPAAQLHLTRAVCRRAERDIVAAAGELKPLELKKMTLRYLNRLSDYLFTLARYLNFLSQEPEKIWKS